MGVNSFKKLNVPSKDIMIIQDNIDFALKPVLANPILNSVILKNVPLTVSVANEVNHKLAQKLTGWVVIRNRADSRIWDAQDANESKRTLVLYTSANTMIDLLVF